MAEFVYSTTLTAPGPWLIDRQSLESLDKILDESWQKLIALRDETIRKEIDEGLSKIPEQTQSEARHHIEERVNAYHSFANHKRELTLVLDDGRKVRAQSFNDAIHDESLSQQVPVGFDFSMNCFSVGCTISLTKQRSQLQIQASPENHPQARELFSTLRLWVNKVEPPRYQQLWRKYASTPEPFIIFIPILFILLMWIILSPAGTLSKDSFEDQAYTLLDKGLSQENELEAIRLILAITSKYNPQRLALPTWAWTYAGLVFVLLIILAIAPRTILGIGEGEKKIKQWRTWTRIVFTTVPGALALAILKKILGVGSG